LAITIESPTASGVPPLNVRSVITAVPTNQPMSVLRVRLVMFEEPEPGPVTVYVAVGGIGGFSAGSVYVIVVPLVDGDLPDNE
jgi:hypothetical protein